MSRRSHPRRGLTSLVWLVAGLVMGVGWFGAVGPATSESFPGPAPIHEDVTPLLAGSGVVVLAAVASRSRRHPVLGGASSPSAPATARPAGTRWGHRPLARPGPAPVRGPPLLLG